MNNKFTFNFKKFKVKHDKCAMKVGTDGVLLGSWTDIENVETALDVGTGTGLIAMMIAQRCSKAKIKGIELDVSASVQATDNVIESIFNNQIDIINADFRDLEIKGTFDLIVSNPPFFVGNLNSVNTKRTQARHTDTLSTELLLKKSFTLLKDKGRLAIIFPSESDNHINYLAIKSGFFVKRKCHVFATIESKLSKRTLWEFSKSESIFNFSKLVIEKSRHVYTQEYIKLTREFYLKM